MTTETTETEAITASEPEPEPEPEPETTEDEDEEEAEDEDDEPEDEPAEIAERVAARAVLVSVSKSTFGLRRKVDVQQLRRTGLLDVDESAEILLGAHKKILDCPEYRAILTLDGQFDREVERRVLSGAYRKGVYHLPLTLVEWFEATWRSYSWQRGVLVEAFARAYEDAVEQAREKLEPAGLFDSSQYPPVSQIRGRFWLERRYQQVGVPGAIADINAGLFLAERQKLQREMEEAALEIRQGLRAGLVQLVDALRDRLEPGEDGKRKRLHTSTVEALQEWLGLFDQRDITGDRPLAEVVGLLRGVMEGVDPDDLRRGDDYTGAVKASLDAVSSLVGTMTAPTRKFDFSGE